jgi:glycosyltransferase involved in cell wall biosynthesis
MMNGRLKIVFLTPGTGGWYCGACMRDNALAKSLQAAGHDVSLLPMYLPLMLDEEVLDNGHVAPVFFGGINMYLQQKIAAFRHVPERLCQLLDHPRLLRRVARHSHMTSARDHGELTLAMLRMENRRFDKSLDPLITWLKQESPDILCLSTALQAGLIRTLKHHLNVKIICCFQGEDSFLDGLPAPFHDACWHELALRVREADALVSPSAFYADLMNQRLGPGKMMISVIPNGIDLRGYSPLTVKPGPPVIGFLARMTQEKGLEILVDAFIHLRTVLGHPDALLHLAGAATRENQALIESLQLRLTAAGLADQARWQTNLSRDEKTEMLGSLTLFSVPAIYQEAFGLYVIEALASGVPVVQPATAAFPEIIETAGVGVLVPFVHHDPQDTQPSHAASPSPNPNSIALAQAWLECLQQPNKLPGLAAASRRAAEQFYDVSVMRDHFLELARAISGVTGGPSSPSI